METKSIVIFGPQGSGKGTQAEILSKKFSLPHISVGELLRQEIKAKTEIGKKIGKILNAGKLAPNEITNQAVKNRLEKNDAKTGFIIEGYPRNLNQAEFMDTIINNYLALEIWISDDEAVKRISQRRTCSNCGAIYHLKYKPPATADICDKCKTKLIIRDDDKEEAIRQRLNIYHNETEPLLKKYKAKGIYYKIDGMPTIPEVTKAIMKIFK